MQMSWALVAAVLVALAAGRGGAVELGIAGTHLTLDGEERFLLGVSYYGGLGAPAEAVQADFDDLARQGINWVRVWATWSSGDENVSAVTGAGEAREPYLGRLVSLVQEADRRGLVADVTLTRGEAAADALHDLAGHTRAVQTLAETLQPYRNVYFDLANEHDVRDARYVSFEDLHALREALRAVDAQRLATASSGDVPDGELLEYVEVAGVDFLSPHRPRDADSPAATEAQTRHTLAALEQLGRPVPVHYQEPFRRDYGPWQPVAADFLADLRGAVLGGAAGWCLHNGSPREGRAGPGRSFDLRPGQGRLLEQLDAEELAALEGMAGTVADATWTR